MKTVLVIVASVVVLSILVYALASALLFGSYRTIEHDAVVKDLERAEDAIGEFASQQMIKLSDWAAWDEAYEYAQDRDPEWAVETVYATGLANLDISTMVWSDTNGEIFQMMAVDIEAREEVSGTSIRDYLGTHKELVTHESLEDATQGIVMLPDGPMILVSLPLTTSEGKGPSPGALTFGRYLDEGKIADLAEVTHLTLSAFRYDAQDLPDDVRRAKVQFSDGTPYIVEPVSENVVHGYALVYDVNEAPAVVLRIESPRPIYAQGKLTFTLFMAAGAVALALFGVIMLLLLDRTVITRLVCLSRDVEDINATKDIKKKVDEGEKDEIGKLGENINRMLGWLKDAREAEAASRREILNLLDEHKQVKDQAEEMERILGKKGV